MKKDNIPVHVESARDNNNIAAKEFLTRSPRRTASDSPKVTDRISSFIQRGDKREQKVSLPPLPLKALGIRRWNLGSDIKIHEVQSSAMVFIDVS